MSDFEHDLEDIHLVKNHQGVQAVFEDLAEKNLAPTEKGQRLERLIARYLRTDPQYANQLEKVWFWSEWPDRWGHDTGIDLVAKEAGTANYWAIQCKFFAPTQYIDKPSIDSFFAASGKRFQTSDGDWHAFSQRLIVSTTSKCK